MQGLEPYPKSDTTSSQTEDSHEYSHVVDFMQNSRSHGKVGTLSLSEWEAISKMIDSTLYLS